MDESGCCTQCGKAAGPSGVVAEMLKASGEAGIDLITELHNSVVSQGAVPKVQLTGSSVIL